MAKTNNQDKKTSTFSIKKRKQAYMNDQYKMKYFFLSEYLLPKIKAIR